MTRQLIVEPIDVEVGERHRRLFSAAANLAEFATMDDLIVAILTEPELDTGLPPREVQKAGCTDRHGTRSTPEGRRGCRVPDRSFVSGADLFAAWRQGVLERSGPPSKTWSIGPAFDHVEVGPERIVVVGSSAPGTGEMSF